jgi:hypothetical protein
MDRGPWTVAVIAATPISACASVTFGAKRKRHQSASSAIRGTLCQRLEVAQAWLTGEPGRTGAAAAQLGVVEATAPLPQALVAHSTAT